MALLGWILNLALGGTAISGADPPTVMPLTVDLATAIGENLLVISRTANSTDPARSKNSVKVP